jgi:hypothetical protein
MSNPTLLVPIQVHALVVNTKVRQLPFRRWRMNYHQLEKFASPDPDAFDGEIETSFDKPKNEGVYLHWTLPATLRHGVQNRETGKIEFPLVPNRWLVMRFSGTLDNRAAKAWVIESDCPFTESAGTDNISLYLDPTSTEPLAQILGKSFPLAGWSEKSIDKLFLTAVAPGNPLFTAYQSNVSNIFSFHDHLSEDNITNSTLSYLVVGWFSNPQADPLHHKADAYQQLLKEYKWTIANEVTDQATSSLYHGMAYGINWDEKGELPQNTVQTITNVHVAIGNNTIDAFKAMIKQQLQDKGQDPKIAELLEAFQYDLLHILEQPNGEAILDQKIRQAWFGSKPGGYRWTIVDKDAKQQKTEAEREQEAKQESWVSPLNDEQSKLDVALKILFANQWQLYATWWKYGKFQTYPPFAQPEGVSEQKFKDTLEPSNLNSLTKQVYDQMNHLNTQNFDVPHPIPDDTPEKAFQNGINAFAKSKQLADDRLLKAISSPRYWGGNDPVVFISGTHNTHRIKPNETLTCRLSTQLISAVKVSDETLTAAQLGNKIPSVDTSRFAPAIAGLIEEFYFLDPHNADSMVSFLHNISVNDLKQLLAAHNAENYQGVIPALELQDWQQPWNPLFMEWSMEWYPIDYQAADGTKNWSFDGIDYHYTGPLPPESSLQRREVKGRTFLTPQSNFTFQEQLKKFIKAHPDSSGLKSLEEFIEQIDQWDFLSQALVGLNDQLALRDSTPNRSPDKQVSYTFADGQTQTLAELVGEQYDHVPLLHGDASPHFQAIRQGQFNLTKLIIYDAFGQILEVIGDSGLKSEELFRPILAEGLQPNQTVVKKDAYRFAQLPPRLLQHARLNFRLVDHQNTTQYVDVNQEANPVCGWLLPNHLEQGISIYDLNGVGLGEIRLFETESGTKQVGWQPAPHSIYQSWKDVKKQAPHLGEMLDKLQMKGETAFKHLLQVIDETLWTVDPLGARDDQNLSVLVGLPLALVRTRLLFELDGPPINSTSWEATFNPPPLEFIHYDYDIRSGDQEIRQDGLIGYFLNENYEIFHSIHKLEEQDKYIQPIQQGNYIQLQFNEESHADVMLLVDPRASIHAFTGILPIKILELPARFIDPALNKMEVSFQVGPLLTQIQQNLAESNPKGGETQPQQAIGMPYPAEKNGQWSWWESQYQPNTPEKWQSYALAKTDQKAHLSDHPKSLRDGYLQLVVNLNKENK